MRGEGREMIQRLIEPRKKPSTSENKTTMQAGKLTMMSLRRSLINKNPSSST